MSRELGGVEWAAADDAGCMRYYAFARGADVDNPGLLCPTRCPTHNQLSKLPTCDLCLHSKAMYILSHSSHERFCECFRVH